MAFRLPAHRPLALALHEAAVSELDAARAAVEQHPPDFHAARLSCKRLRAWLRLLRPELGPCYAPANRLLRDAARQLSPFRDAEVLSQTLHGLRSLHLRKAELSRLDWFLAQSRPPPSRPRTAIRIFLELIEQARALIVARPLQPLPRGALPRNLHAGYQLCRRRLPQAQRERSPAALHEWRKALKYHLYQCSLLTERWTQLRGSRGRALKLLTERLGEHHDLEGLRTALQAGPMPARLRALAEAAARVACERQRRLEEEALNLGAALFGAPARARGPRLLAA